VSRVLCLQQQNNGVSRCFNQVRSYTERIQSDIPVAVQLIPGGLLFIGAFFLPESPRWFRSRGRLDEAQSILAFIRQLPGDHQYIQEELLMMDEQLAATAAYRSYGAQIRELAAKGMRNRLASAFAMMSKYFSFIKLAYHELIECTPAWVQFACQQCSRI
jgi:hypothetical protein